VIFFTAVRAAHHPLTSLPTRRSSDLNFSNPFADAVEDALRILVNLGYTDVDQDNGYRRTHDQAGLNADGGGVPFGTRPDIDWARSEEHTSELQSRENLVCRLLTEKKS